MLQTGEVVEATVPYAKACSEAHVQRIQAVSGFMHEKAEGSAYFVKVPYKAPPTEPSAK